ncbi:MAG: hypothetical protein AB8B73_16070 [Ekhidna sp.]
MKNQINYFLIAVFSIFLGSQITEGVLLVPYWQSLSAADFYSYYQDFGTLINGFYTILTITALVIPIAVSAHYYRSKSPNLRFAIMSSLFAVLFVACFYVYFKGTNELFLQSGLSEADLKNELMTWGKWHWGRVVLESCSLLFLILAFSKGKK